MTCTSEQGLGHDTLYPAWDVINANLGGASALEALVGAVPVSISHLELSRSTLTRRPHFIWGSDARPLIPGCTMQAASGSNLSSVSYHVNSDEAYELYNGAPNPEFDVNICRLQVC